MTHFIHADVRKQSPIFVLDLPIARQSMHRSCDKPLSTHFLILCFTMLPKPNFETQPQWVNSSKNCDIALFIPDSKWAMSN